MRAREADPVADERVHVRGAGAIAVDVIRAQRVDHDQDHVRPVGTERGLGKSERGGGGCRARPEEAPAGGLVRIDRHGRPHASGPVSRSGTAVGARSRGRRGAARASARAPRGALPSGSGGVAGSSGRVPRRRAQRPSRATSGSSARTSSSTSAVRVSLVPHPAGSSTAAPAPRLPPTRSAVPPRSLSTKPRRPPRLRRSPDSSTQSSGGDFTSVRDTSTVRISPGFERWSESPFLKSLRVQPPAPGAGSQAGLAVIAHSATAYAAIRKSVSAVAGPYRAGPAPWRRAPPAAWPSPASTVTAISTSRPTSVTM